MKTRTIALLAAFAALAAAVSCNKIDSTGQALPDAPKTYTLSINATRASEDTKALGADYSVTWASGEKVSVYNVTKGELLTGYLSPSTTGTASTTLTGTVTSPSGIAVDDELRLVWCAGKDTEGAISYDAQPGNLDGIRAGFYYEVASVTATSAAAAGSGISPAFTDAHFKSNQAVATFRFKIGGNVIAPESVRVFALKMNHSIAVDGSATEGFINVTPGGTATTIALSIAGADGSTAREFTFYITYSGKIYKGTTSCKLAHNKYYGATAPIEIALTEYMTVPTKVDLGLKSSVNTSNTLYWADRNIGAKDEGVSKYEESKSGEYFPWGGLLTTAGTYDEKPYKDTPDTLPIFRDVANFVLGGAWRLPRLGEIGKTSGIQSTDYCIWSDWDGTNKGYTVHGKNGYASNSIFFPATGYLSYGAITVNSYSDTYYWSSDIVKTLRSNAYSLTFSHLGSHDLASRYCYLCQSVRPVSE